VDSTAVLHYAAQKVTRLKTFSISFAGRSFDESRWFREVAQVYGTEHHEFDVNPEVGLAGAIEEMAYYSDEPSADAGALPVWFLSKMTRAHVTVALSGEGADELFAGYQTYLADAIARRMYGAPEWVRKLALGAAKLLPPSDEKIGLDYKVQRFFAGTLLAPDEAHFSWNGTNGFEDKMKLAPAIAHRRTGDLCQGIGARVGTLNRYLWADQLYYLPDDILYKCDRMSMAHSLEVRPPFLDHRIVEFAARLPERLKLKGGTTKYVLRELLRDKIPASVLARPKQGFDIPTHHWFRTVLKELLLGAVNERTVREAGIFSWPAVEGLMERHFARKQNAGYSLWGLLTLFLWMKRWNIRTTADHSRPLPTAAVITN
jgi:asparagine synthase (glutamine-hydrolysing)